MRFLVARNPDPDSSLPYLLRIPVDGGLILKARDTWPRTARIYCHRADEWPADAEVVDDVPVVDCRRRGVAIDLVLDRARDYRSQFVFTRLPNGDPHRVPGDSGRRRGMGVSLAGCRPARARWGPAAGGLRVTGER